jgi:hypothetical protein
MGFLEGMGGGRAATHPFILIPLPARSFSLARGLAGEGEGGGAFGNGPGGEKGFGP